LLEDGVCASKSKSNKLASLTEVDEVEFSFLVFEEDEDAFFAALALAAAACASSSFLLISLTLLDLRYIKYIYI